MRESKVMLLTAARALSRFMLDTAEGAALCGVRAGAASQVKVWLAICSGYPVQSRALVNRLLGYSGRGSAINIAAIIKHCNYRTYLGAGNYGELRPGA